MELPIKYVVCLSWVTTLYIAGIILFGKGFLLTRFVVNQESTCDVEFRIKSDHKLSDQDQVQLDTDLAGCWSDKRFKKAVIIIIDAWRYDFVAFNPFVNVSNELPFQNKFPFVNKLLSRNPENARLYPFIADPPTTTLQRLKGLTTGSLPTFVDAGSNFASSEIQEDNIIDQFLSLNKKITFMGDATWTDLFPNRFNRSFTYPSLNVKDLHTVDNGVIKHLVPELKRDDWDILIAHFLGVDHCGHRYGPNHPAMAEKLEQMDNVLRSVVTELHEDTIMFVFGDHGMTKTGDHGGDSWDELQAALFVYSPSKITASPQSTEQDGPVTVLQTDFVPTISLLLGSPVPFSNLGSIITDLFNYCPWWPTTASPVRQIYHVVKALRLNAHQVKHFVSEYSKLSSEFPSDRAAELQLLFSRTERELLELVTQVQLNASDATARLSRFRDLKDSYLHYLRGIRSMCENIWAKFDLPCMALGLVVTLVGFIVSLYMTRTSSLSSEMSNGLCLSLGCFVWASLLLGLLYLFDSLSLAVGFGLLIILAISLLVYKLVQSHKVLTWASPVQENTFSSQNVSLYISCIFMLLHLTSLFSNSYVVYEDSVTSFLLQSWVWIKVCQINHALCKASNLDNTMQKVPKTLKSSKLPLKLSSRLLLLILAIVFCVCVRVSKTFRACREEQWTCEPSYFQWEMSAIPVEFFQYKNLRYLLSASAPTIIALAICYCLRKAGNLNGNMPAVFGVRFLLPAAVVCVGFHWALQALPNQLLKQMPDWQQVVLAQCVYFITLLIILLLLWNPLCLYMVDRRNSRNLVSFSGVSGEDILPRLYNHMKINWKKHFAGNEETKAPVVYGLASVYSAAVLALCSSVAVLLTMLLGDGMAPTVPLQLITMWVILELHACHQQLLQQKTDGVPWTVVYVWAVIASHFFFATGHQTTVTTIRWESAYVGFYGDFNNYVLPGILIVLNTFASQVLCVAALPLLFLWPYSQGRFLFMFENNKEQTDKNNVPTGQKGEFVLHEDPVLLSSSLFQTVLSYIIFHGSKVLAAMCSAGLHHRHLMVWKIFAPRAVFESATFAFVVTLSFFLYIYILRIDSALSKWVKTLKKLT